MRTVFLGLLLFSAGAVMASTADAPRPDWLTPWRESTVALGKIDAAEVKKPDGTTEKKDVFVVVGTGVLLGRADDPTKTPWLVTASLDSHRGAGTNVIAHGARRGPEQRASLR